MVEQDDLGYLDLAACSSTVLVIPQSNCLAFLCLGFLSLGGSDSSNLPLQGSSDIVGNGLSDVVQRAGLQHHFVAGLVFPR